MAYKALVTSTQTLSGSVRHKLSAVAHMADQLTLLVSTSFIYKALKHRYECPPLE